MEEKEEQAKKAIFHNQNLKKNQLLKLKIAKENKGKTVSEQNDLEKLFCECVNNATNEALKRRNKQTMSKYGTKEKFLMTAADKRKILEEFITNSQVYTLLAEKLFPDDLSKVVKLQEALASEHHQSGENESIDSLFKHQNDFEPDNFAYAERLFEPN